MKSLISDKQIWLVFDDNLGKTLTRSCGYSRISCNGDSNEYLQGVFMENGRKLSHQMPSYLFFSR